MGWRTWEGIAYLLLNFLKHCFLAVVKDLARVLPRVLVPFTIALVQVPLELELVPLGLALFHCSASNSYGLSGFSGDHTHLVTVLALICLWCDWKSLLLQEAIDSSCG